MEPTEDITAQRILLELEFIAGEADRRAVLTCFGNALEPIRQMLVQQEIRQDARPQQKFAIVHLLIRSLSDLSAGGHLASHFYVTQSYCVRFDPVQLNAELHRGS